MYLIDKTKELESKISEFNIDCIYCSENVCLKIETPRRTVHEIVDCHNCGKMYLISIYHSLKIKTRKVED